MHNQDPLLKTVKRSSSAVQATGALLGFLLFLSGDSLLLYVLLDIVTRLESFHTVFFLVLGIALYKLGRAVLHHFATFKVHAERRRVPHR